MLHRNVPPVIRCCPQQQPANVLTENQKRFCLVIGDALAEDWFKPREAGHSADAVTCAFTELPVENTPSRECPTRLSASRPPRTADDEN